MWVSKGVTTSGRSTKLILPGILVNLEIVTLLRSLLSASCYSDMVEDKAISWLIRFSPQ